MVSRNEERQDRIRNGKKWEDRRMQGSGIGSRVKTRKHIWAYWRTSRVRVRLMEGRYSYYIPKSLFSLPGPLLFCVFEDLQRTQFRVLKTMTGFSESVAVNVRFIHHKHQRLFGVIKRGVTGNRGVFLSVLLLTTLWRVYIMFAEDVGGRECVKGRNESFNRIWSYSAAVPDMG